MEETFSYTSELLGLLLLGSASQSRSETQGRRVLETFVWTRVRIPKTPCRPEALERPSRGLLRRHVGPTFWGPHVLGHEKLTTGLWLATTKFSSLRSTFGPPLSHERLTDDTWTSTRSVDSTITIGTRHLYSDSLLRPGVPLLHESGRPGKISLVSAGTPVKDREDVRIDRGEGGR